MCPPFYVFFALISESVAKMKNMPLIIVFFSSGLDLQTVKRNINTCRITSVLTSKNPEQHGEVNIA